MNELLLHSDVEVNVPPPDEKVVVFNHFSQRL